MSCVFQGGRAGNGTGSELRTVEVCSSIPTGTSSEFEGPTPVEWLFTSDMTVPRTCLAAASLGDSLYAVGGQAGRQIWDTVESYDAQQDAWVQLPGHMHSERKYTSAGVLHGTHTSLHCYRLHHAVSPCVMSLLFHQMVLDWCQHWNVWVLYCKAIC